MVTPSPRLTYQSRPHDGYFYFDPDLFNGILQPPEDWMKYRYNILIKILQEFNLFILNIHCSQT